MPTDLPHFVQGDKHRESLLMSVGMVVGDGTDGATSRQDVRRQVQPVSHKTEGNA
jgi:hypothetical protein